MPHLVATLIYFPQNTTIRGDRSPLLYRLTKHSKNDDFDLRLHKRNANTLNYFETRKGVPKLQGPALGCMSAIDKNSASIFCKDNCIGRPHGQES